MTFACAAQAARDSARGVTLLELLIVLMIIAFVTAITIPMLGSGVSNAELRSAARQLAAGLRLARSEAVSQRRETFLVVDLAGRRFKVDRDRGALRCQERRAQALHRAAATWSTTRPARSASSRTAAATAAASRSAPASASTKSTSTGSPAASRSSTDHAQPVAARGFSLIEVLVAFVILALVATALFRLFSSSLNNASAAEDYSRAVLVAESRLEAAAAQQPLKEASDRGSEDDGRIAVGDARRALRRQGHRSRPRARLRGLAMRLFRVSVDVKFTGSDGRPRTFSLATMRMGPRSPA